MGELKTSDYIKFEIMMQNPNQDPPASPKAQNKEMKDMDMLCTFKIKRKSQNPE